MASRAPSARHAFTLIELLVVIAVIGLLASLLLPALSRAQAASKSAHCKGNLKQLGTTLRMLVDDREFYPFYLLSNPSDRERLGRYLDDRGHDSNWEDALTFYLEPERAYSRGNYALFSCLAQSRKVAQPGRVLGGSYAYNGWGIYDVTWGDTTGLGGLGSFRGGRWPDSPTRESDVRVPSDMLAIGDAFVRSDQGGIFESSALLSRNGYRSSEPTQLSVARKRHGGTLNVVFCDGHVSGLTIQSLFFDITDEALGRWNRDNEPHRDRLKGQAQ